MFYPFYTYTSCVYVSASVSYYVDEAGKAMEPWLASAL